MTRTVGTRFRIEVRLLMRAWLGVWLVALPGLFLLRLLHPAAPAIALCVLASAYAARRMMHAVKMRRSRAERQGQHV